MTRTLPRLTLLVLGALLWSAGVAHAAEVRLTDGGFDPATVNVEAGESVVWMNATEDEHTIIGPGGVWDSGPLAPGETFSIVLRDAGTVSYGTAEGDFSGRISVTGTAAAPEASNPALPRTGLPAAALAVLAVALLGVGFLLVRQGRATP